MAVTFNPLAFLRSAPNYLLREYFTRKGLLGHVEWDHRGEYDMEPIFQAIVALPEEVQDSVMHDFRDLHARTRDGGFVKAILDEATYHKVDTDLAERFERMKRHLERTFWIFLHRKEQYWDGANIFWRVDKLAGASQWQARGGLPAQPGPIDEGVVEDLRNSLINYFSSREARGRRCKVEAYRRGDEDIFYAYPEDYKQTVSEYVGEKLQPRTVQPTFEIIFRHNDSQRRLDIHVEGDSVTVGRLQVAFARSVLKEDIEEKYEDDPPIYVLQPLLSRSFEFRWRADLEIESVRIKGMRLFVQGGRWRRITIETDPSGKPKAVYDLLDAVAKGLPTKSLRLDQVVLSVIFRRGARDRRTPTRTVTITVPHICRMTSDERGEQIHRMLEQSGVERHGTAKGATEAG